MAETSVWDPIIILKEDHTGAQAAGIQWVSEGYTIPVDEAIEIFRLEIIPPVDPATNLIEQFSAEILIDGKPVESLRIHNLMAPADAAGNLGLAVDFGIPYMHRPISGIIPSAIEGTTIKAKEGQLVQVRTTAIDSITQDYSTILKYARVKSNPKLVEVVGAASVPVSFTLNGDLFPKGNLPVSLATWDELPGGMRQAKPEIHPWQIYVTNKSATTVNTWYDFTYPNYVSNKWQELDWNLINKNEAYLFELLSVVPHTNSKAARFYTEGRVTNPEFITRPLPELNYFLPPQFLDTTVTSALKKVGPRQLAKPILFHGVKGGLEIIDNGTQIPAEGVQIFVWGKKFILR